MTDTPPGPGWWLASDGRWYPPETAPAVSDGWLTNDSGATQVAPWAGQQPVAQHPGEQPPVHQQPIHQQPVHQQPIHQQPVHQATGGWSPAPPPGLGGTTTPTGWQPNPVATSPQWPAAAPAAVRGGGSNNLWILLGVGIGLVVLLGGGLAALAATRDDDPVTTASTAATSPADQNGSGTTSAVGGTTSFPATTGGAIVTNAPPTRDGDPDAADPVADLEELVSELAIDFSDGAATDSPVACEVTGIQSYSDDYAVDAIVTNNDGVPSAYKLEYELLGPAGESLGADSGIIDRIEPGTTVADDTLGVINGTPAPEDVTCEVTSVVRVDA